MIFSCPGAVAVIEGVSGGGESLVPGGFCCDADVESGSGSVCMILFLAPLKNCL
jgi:hypothetical protein